LEFPVLERKFYTSITQNDRNGVDLMLIYAYLPSNPHWTVISVPFYFTAVMIQFTKLKGIRQLSKTLSIIRASSLPT
jgi:hypothetical protein